MLFGAFSSRLSPQAGAALSLPGLVTLIHSRTFGNNDAVDVLHRAVLCHLMNMITHRRRTDPRKTFPYPLNHRLLCLLFNETKFFYKFILQLSSTSFSDYLLSDYFLRLLPSITFFDYYLRLLSSTSLFFIENITIHP